jgi:hypothetical protein
MVGPFLVYTVSENEKNTLAYFELVQVTTKCLLTLGPILKRSDLRKEGKRGRYEIQQNSTTQNDPQQNNTVQNDSQGME